MANSKQARKRARQATKRRAHNMSQRSSMRTYIKRVLEAVEKGDKAAASEAYTVACSALDKAANKGLIHKNKAARHKSNLSVHLKAVGGAPVAKAAAKPAPKKAAAKPAAKKEAKPAAKPAAKKEAKPAAKKEAAKK